MTLVNRRFPLHSNEAGKDVPLSGSLAECASHRVASRRVVKAASMQRYAAALHNQVR
jgi:hypothetical protein